MLKNSNAPATAKVGITSMPELTERQRLILALVVRDYTETAQPVGSARLAERYRLDFSPASEHYKAAAFSAAARSAKAASRAFLT